MNEIENKEIEKMAFEIAFSIVGDTVDKQDAEKIMPTAKALFRLGYRKQSETVKEFVEKVNEIVKNTHNISSWHIWAIQEQINKLAEQRLKEKKE